MTATQPMTMSANLPGPAEMIGLRWSEVPCTASGSAGYTLCVTVAADCSIAIGECRIFLSADITVHFDTAEF